MVSHKVLSEKKVSLKSKIKAKRKEFAGFKKRQLTSSEQNELQQLYFNYGECVACLINDRALMCEEFREKHFQKQLKVARQRNIVSYLRQNYSSDSKKTCTLTGRCYYIFCFDLARTAGDGVYNQCKGARKVLQKVRGCWERSQTRSLTREGYKREFELCQLSLLRLFKKQNWRCALSGKRLHSTPNCEGNFSVDRVDNSKDYSLGNTRIVSSCFQAAYGFTLSSRDVQRRLDPNLAKSDPLPIEIHKLMELLNKEKHKIPDFDKGKLRQCTSCNKWLNREIHYSRCYRDKKFKRFRQCKICVAEIQKHPAHPYRKRKRPEFVGEFGKRCRRCNTVKNRDTSFHKRTHTCKECRACREPWEVLDGIVNSAIQADKKKSYGCKSSVSREDVLELLKKQSGRCKITNEPLLFNSVESKDRNATKYNCSIDRIDNNQGHTISNIRLIAALWNVKGSGRTVYSTHL